MNDLGTTNATERKISFQWKKMKTPQFIIRHFKYNNIICDKDTMYAREEVSFAST